MTRTATLGVALAGLVCLTPAAASLGSLATRAPALYGATIDRITGLDQTLNALRTLPEPPTVRVVFDRSEPSGYYSAATRRLDAVSQVMGELLDSSSERSISASGLRARARSYLHRLGRYVSIWELGNELNGNWTGPYGQVAAKTRAAFSVFQSANVPLALTLYANDFGPDHCGDGLGELTPVQFARRYLSPSIRDGLSYLLLSYYPTECGGIEPSASEVAAHLRQLHQLFPHARLGFGEVGLPHPVSRTTVTQARQIMHWAYGLRTDLSYYAGGYFWWYAAEDALGPSAPLRRNLIRAFTAEQRALGGS